MEPREGDIDCASRPSVLCSEAHMSQTICSFLSGVPRGWQRAFMVPHEITSSVTDSAASARKTPSKLKSWNFSGKQIQIESQKFSDPAEDLEKVRRAELKLYQAHYMSAIAIVDSLLLMMWTFWELARPTVPCTSDTCVRPRAISVLLRASPHIRWCSSKKYYATAMYWKLHGKGALLNDVSSSTLLIADLNDLCIDHIDSLCWSGLWFPQDASGGPRQPRDSKIYNPWFSLLLSLSINQVSSMTINENGSLIQDAVRGGKIDFLRLLLEHGCDL